MLQDANCTRGFVLNRVLVMMPAAVLLLAGVMFMTSCAGGGGVFGGGGGAETRRVNQGYLAASGNEADGAAVGDAAASDFEQIQSAIMGGGEGAASAELDEYAGMLDSHLTDLGGDGAVEERESAILVANGNERLEKRVEVEPARPRVNWAAVGDDGQKTLADREELIGSAKNPQRTRAERGGGGADTAMGVLEADGGTDVGGGNGAVVTPSKKAFSMDEMVVMLSGQLHRSAAYSGAPLREYIVDAAMLAWDPTRKIDPAELYNLNERERELLGDLQAFFIEMGTQLRETRDPETILDAVNKLARGLGTAGGLEIPIFRLCLSVDNFGTYEEVESMTFVRGFPHEVITYIEVAHFQPRAEVSGLFKTLLSQEAELYASDGTIVHRQVAVTAEDYCRNIRRDFFLVRHLRLPANLSVGSYDLKVRVTDEATGQEAEAVLPIEIVASVPDR